MALLVCLFVWLPAARANERVSHTPGGAVEAWRIDEPNIQQPVTEYPNVKFQPGDRVWIDAGGCVQTGGAGLTWKRYVNPDGEAADRRYHGLAFIPGVMPGLVRIAGLIGRPLDIPTHGAAPWRLYLTLGYEDDNYGDNGYWGHDDGTGNQCRGVGPAWVNVMIQHGVNARDHGNSTGPKPFDLVWSSTDPNGFPRNPTWNYVSSQPNTILDPDGSCNIRWTQQGVEQDCSILKLANDTPSDLKSHTVGSGVGPLQLCRSPEPINGHLNFGEVVIEGQVDHRHFDPPELYADVSIVPIHIAEGDDDVNLYLAPLSIANAPLAMGNHAASDGQGLGSIDLEFDSDETTDHFGGSTWWQQFSADENFIKNKYAVAVGLLGFDATHKFTTELHPLHALAVRTREDMRSDGTVVEEWGYFVRNWGNEGECSQEDHPTVFPNNDFIFRLPWRTGMHLTDFNRGDWVQNGWDPNNSKFPGWGTIADERGVPQAVTVEFDGFPSPLQHPWVAGRFWLVWSPGWCGADLQTDPNNCGACFFHCADGYVCSAGACACPAGKTSCGGVCVDSESFQTDATNCSVCGSACSGGTPLCVAGQCTCSRDLVRDPANCGACDIRCESGQCAEGVCQCVSDRPTLCNRTTCTNLQTDRENCGACGQECTGTCQGGQCVCPTSTPGRCTTGSITTCVDFKIDSSNCGACSHSCNNFACENGVCSTTLCADGMKKCGQRRCIPEDQSCRSCGPCPRGTYCDNGECVPGLPE